MARLKLKQVLSNLQYDTANDQLIISGSNSNIPDFTISGSLFVTSSDYTTGSITIAGLDTFGDSGSFNTIDLGDY